MTNMTVSCDLCILLILVFLITESVDSREGETHRAGNTDRPSKLFERRVNKTRMICAKAVTAEGFKVPRSQVSSFVIDKNYYASTRTKTNNCVSRRALLLENQPQIEQQYSALRSYQYQLENCIEANKVFNARRPDVQRYIQQNSRKIIRHSDFGLERIISNLPMMVPFRLKDDAINRTALTYCSSAESSLDFTQRLSEVIASLNDYLKSFQASTVVLIRASCRHRGIPASPRPSLQDHQCIDTGSSSIQWPIVFVLVAAIIVVLGVLSVVMYCARMRTRMLRRFPHNEIADFIELVELKSAAKQLMRAVSV